MAEPFNMSFNYRVLVSFTLAAIVAAVLSIHRENALPLPPTTTTHIARPELEADAVQAAHHRVAHLLSDVARGFEAAPDKTKPPPETAAASTMAFLEKKTASLKKKLRVSRNRKQLRPPPLPPGSPLARGGGVRHWGCGLTATPFVFVHIGKAGGGSMRRAIARAGHNLTETHRKSWAEGNQYFTTSAADEEDFIRFCNSGHVQHWPDRRGSYEGTQECAAMTPYGQALACPEWTYMIEGHCRENAKVVYVGHNGFGSDIHWLPRDVLAKWWWGNASSSPPGDLRHPCWFSPAWQAGNSKRCCGQPGSRKEWRDTFEKCWAPLADEIDGAAVVVGDGIDKSYSDVYASLPTLRAVVLREPFSWLQSKYFWHKPDVGSGGDDGRLLSCAEAFSDTSGPGVEWLAVQALALLYDLCGPDCSVRYEAGVSGLETLEVQAEENLRNAFAVVGLVEDASNFIWMLDRRVEYLNMVLEDVEHSHASQGNEEAKADCKAFFKQERARLEESKPELATLSHLYRVAVEVNTAQTEELRACPQLPLREEETRD